METDPASPSPTPAPLGFPPAPTFVSIKTEDKGKRLSYTARDVLISAYMLRRPHAFAGLMSPTTGYYNENKYPSYALKEAIALEVSQIDRTSYSSDRIGNWFGSRRQHDGTTKLSRQQHQQQSGGLFSCTENQWLRNQPGSSPAKEGNWQTLTAILASTPQSVWTDEWLYTVFTACHIGHTAGMMYTAQARALQEARASSSGEPIDRQGPPPNDMRQTEASQLPTPASSMSPELKARTPSSVTNPSLVPSAPIPEHRVPDNRPPEDRPGNQTPPPSTATDAQIAGQALVTFAHPPPQFSSAAREPFTYAGPCTRPSELAPGSKANGSLDAFPLVTKPPTDKQQWVAQFNVSGSLMQRLLERRKEGTLRLRL
jgi:hypothetical protein